MKVKITFTNDVLGMRSGSEDMLEKYIVSKAPSAELAEDEMEKRSVADEVADRTTIFEHDVDGTPVLIDYQWKGFFKESVGFLNKAGKDGYAGGKVCSGIKSYKKNVDGLVFIKPRWIRLDLHGMRTGTLSRSLRASTMQGERISIARSETVPEGTTCEFEIICLNETMEKAVREALDYGALHGFGQWRNAGYGTFTWEELHE